MYTQEALMSNASSRPEPKVLLDGLAYVESPRWHEGRLWFPHWGTGEIVAVDLDGHSARHGPRTCCPGLVHRLVARWPPPGHGQGAAAQGAERVDGPARRPQRDLQLRLERDRRGRERKHLPQQHQL